MKNELVRFGVAMEAGLVRHLDAMAEARNCNRSELLRDLTRAEISRTFVDDRVPAYAAVTLVYNHHVHELAERLMALQHDLGDQVRSTMHIHLNHEHCLEVIVMRGRSDELKRVAGRLIGTRGVVQGAAEYFAEGTLNLTDTAHPGHEHHHADPIEAPVTRSKAKSRTSKARRKSW